MKLLFQPAEEGGAGASHMIKEGALDGVEAIFGMHVDYQLPTGKISSRPGPTQAAVCFFEVKLEGKGGDAAAPHLNVDPIIAASFSILALQLLISREDDPLHSQVCYTDLTVVKRILKWVLKLYKFGLVSRLISSMGYTSPALVYHMPLVCTMHVSAQWPFPVEITGLALASQCFGPIIQELPI